MERTKLPNVSRSSSPCSSRTRHSSRAARAAPPGWIPTGMDWRRGVSSSWRSHAFHAGLSSGGGSPSLPVACQIACSAWVSRVVFCLMSSRTVEKRNISAARRSGRTSVGGEATRSRRRASPPPASRDRRSAHPRSRILVRRRSGPQPVLPRCASDSAAELEGDAGEVLAIQLAGVAGSRCYRRRRSRQGARPALRGSAGDAGALLSAMERSRRRLGDAARGSVRSLRGRSGARSSA